MICACVACGVGSSSSRQAGGMSGRILRMRVSTRPRSKGKGALDQGLLARRSGVPGKLDNDTPCAAAINGATGEDSLDMAEARDGEKRRGRRAWRGESCGHRWTGVTGITDRQWWMDKQSSVRRRNEATSASRVQGAVAWTAATCSARRISLLLLPHSDRTAMHSDAQRFPTFTLFLSFDPHRGVVLRSRAARSQRHKHTPAPALRRAGCAPGASPRPSSQAAVRADSDAWEGQAEAAERRSAAASCAAQISDPRCATQGKGSAPQPHRECTDMHTTGDVDSTCNPCTDAMARRPAVSIKRYASSSSSWRSSGNSDGERMLERRCESVLV